MDQSIEPE